MGWYDRFQEVSHINGDTQREINQSLLQSTFDEYFKDTPDKITDGLIDGQSVDFVIQHIKYGEDISDVKLLLTENSTSVYSGSIIDFDSKKWLAINEENRAIDTHKAFKIQLCNNTISWKDENGNIYTENCIYKPITTRDDSNKKLPRVDSTILINVQNNSNTSNIAINDRFIFSHKWAYYTTVIDDMDVQDVNGHNIIWITMEKDVINDELDDLENNIASRYINNDSDVPVNGISFTIDEMNAKIGLELYTNVYEYANSIIQPTTFTFRIDGIDSSKYELVGVDGNTVMVKSLDYYYSGNLVAISDSDLSETIIPIELSGII